MTIHTRCLYADQDGYADVLADMASSYMLFPKAWWCLDEVSLSCQRSCGAHVACCYTWTIASLHVVQYALSSEVVAKLTASMCLYASPHTVATVSINIS